MFPRAGEARVQEPRILLLHLFKVKSKRIPESTVTLFVFMMPMCPFLSHLVGSFQMTFFGHLVPGYPFLTAFGFLFSVAISRIYLSLSSVASRFPGTVGCGHLISLTSAFVCGQRRKMLLVCKLRKHKMSLIVQQSHLLC